MRSRDGRWIRISERKTHEEGTVAVCTDLTDFKKRETELTQGNQAKDNVLREFHAVLDTIDYGILFLDADLTIRIHNRAFRDIWELPESFFEGTPTLRDIIERTGYSGLFGVHESTRERVANALFESIRKGNIPTFLQSSGYTR